MAKRQSEIEIPFTRNADGKSAFAIVDHKVVLKDIAVDDYYLVFDFVRNALVVCKRDRSRERKPVTPIAPCAEKA